MIILVTVIRKLTTNIKFYVMLLNVAARTISALYLCVVTLTKWIHLERGA